eukprot:g1938.t1
MNGDVSFSLERQLERMLGEKVEDSMSSGEPKKKKEKETEKSKTVEEQIPLAYSSLGRSEFTRLSEMSKKEEEGFEKVDTIIEKTQTPQEDSSNNSINTTMRQERRSDPINGTDLSSNTFVESSQLEQRRNKNISVTPYSVTSATHQIRGNNGSILPSLSSLSDAKMRQQEAKTDPMSVKPTPKFSNQEQLYETAKSSTLPLSSPLTNVATKQQDKTSPIV